MAIADGPCPGLCPLACGGPSSSWRGKYQGFNDSHLCEKLNAEEKFEVSRETVRRTLRAAKLASPQKRRLRRPALRHDGAHRRQPS
jgi:hypothetical protein